MIIEKYPDKITLANPGTIIAGKNQMLKGGISQPRNKGLFKMFNLLGYGEHPMFYFMLSCVTLGEMVKEKRLKQALVVRNGNR